MKKKMYIPISADRQALSTFLLGQLIRDLECYIPSIPPYLPKLSDSIIKKRDRYIHTLNLQELIIYISQSLYNIKIKYTVVILYHIIYGKQYIEQMEQKDLRRQNEKMEVRNGIVLDGDDNVGGGYGEGCLKGDTLCQDVGSQGARNIVRDNLDKQVTETIFVNKILESSTDTEKPHSKPTSLPVNIPKYPPDSNLQLQILKLTHQSPVPPTSLPSPPSLQNYTENIYNNNNAYQNADNSLQNILNRLTKIEDGQPLTFFNNYNNNYNNVIFSNSRAREFGTLNCQNLLPNTECLGCIRFFYQDLGYRFENTNQSFHIMSTRQAYKKNEIKRYLSNLVQNCTIQDSYLFITDHVLDLDQTYVSGFNCKDYKYEEFLRYLIEKIKHITYEKGQVNVSVVNFSITLLPIFKDFVKKVDLDMLDIKNKNKKIKQNQNQLINLQQQISIQKYQQKIRDLYTDRFVIRVKYQPEKYRIVNHLNKLNPINRLELQSHRQYLAMCALQQESDKSRDKQINVKGCSNSNLVGNSGNNTNNNDNGNGNKIQMKTKNNRKNKPNQNPKIHWPISCQKPLPVDFLPKTRTNQIQILQQMQIKNESFQKYPKININNNLQNQNQSIKLNDSINDSQIQNDKFINYFKYSRTTLIELTSRQKQYVIVEIRNKLEEKKIRNCVFQPFLELRRLENLGQNAENSNNSNNSKNRKIKIIWAISHDCQYHIIKNLIKQIIKKLDDINNNTIITKNTPSSSSAAIATETPTPTLAPTSPTKSPKKLTLPKPKLQLSSSIKIHIPQRYLMLKTQQQQFFLSGIFKNFRKTYQNLTSSPYIIYNTKNHMKLLPGLHSSIYLVFENYVLGVLAMCVFLDVGVDRIWFQRPLEFEDCHTDTQKVINVNVNANESVNGNDKLNNIKNSEDKQKVQLSLHKQKQAQSNNL